jgi:hypothetical protein
MAYNNIDLHESSQNIEHQRLSNRRHNKDQASFSNDLLLVSLHHTTSCARAECRKNSQRDNFLSGIVLALCFQEMEKLLVQASQDKRYPHHFLCSAEHYEAMLQKDALLWSHLSSWLQQRIG